MKPAEIHELEQRIDALAREYGASHDPQIIAELKELSHRLRELQRARTNSSESVAALQARP